MFNLDAEKIAIVSAMKSTIDSRKPELGALTLRVTDAGGNAVKETVTVLIEAVAEASREGTLPTLAGSPIKRQIQGNTTIGDVRAHFVS